MEVKAEYLAIFSEEAGDQLREWEESLLALEKAPTDREPLNNLFRAVHTLKGSAGFIGFDLLQKLAHDLESSLSNVRDGERSYDGALSDMLFQGLDLARSLIETFSAGTAVNSAEAARSVDDYLARLVDTASGKKPKARKDSAAPAPAPKAPAAAAPAAAAPAAAPPSRPAPVAAPPEPARTAEPPKTPAAAAAPAGPVPAAPTAAPTGGLPRMSRLKVRIDGQNREAYLRSCIVRARFDRMGSVMRQEPEPETLRDSTDPFVYTVTISCPLDVDQIVSAISVDQVTVEAVPEPSAAPAPAAAAVAAGGPASAELAEAGEGPKPSGGELPKGGRPEEVVRVSVQKLDTLLNLVGELVIHNSGFATVTQQLRDEYGKTKHIYDLEEKTEALAAITRDLQDGIMKARMLPIANVFNRFRRVVRDLAKASGKSVSLDVFGEETEIDKKVIDRIGEPLVHLVRNSVDHGLETAADRLAAGKPESGVIRLGAYQDGDHICIEVADDGRGLDREAILRKALEKGLLASDEAARASPEQVLGFIFLPGFSTARVVSDISGRGVGMDAVKRAVDEMNGNLRVRSTPGAGTTVTISLPLTMAIIGAVLVEAAGSTYAIPISAVREIVKATEDMLKTVGTRRTMLLRNEVLALVNLARALKANGDGRRAVTGSTADKVVAGATRPVVVVDYEGRKIGLEVDGIVGSREVVIKSLSRHYREVDGLIGASILGNGKIALIVDVETMISQHHTSRGSTMDSAGMVRETAGETPRLAPPPGVAAPAARPLAPAAAAPVAPAAVAPVPAAPAAAAPAPAVSAPAAEKPAAEAPAAPPAAAPAQKAPATSEPIEQLARDVSSSRGRLLEDVNNQGAIEASMSLSQLTGQDIRVSFPESRLVAIKDVAEIMGGEESTVGGMYVGVVGDLEAGMLLVIPEKNLLVLDDLLHRRSVGTAKDLGTVDLSGISEMGNLLASCFLNAMADSAHLALNPEVPEISVDMCLPVIDSVLARFNQPGDKILLTEAVIYGGGSENVVCHQVMFLEPDSMRRLMDALSRAARQGGAMAPAAPSTGATPGVV
ncbi:MAG TPA: chemotaxis protein CheW [Spirochaetia bacterium]|nr:chemotaxis protein CheW [Spirochaetia bacterium]